LFAIMLPWIRFTCCMLLRLNSSLTAWRRVFHHVVSGFLVQSQCPYSSHCDCGGVLEICHIMWHNCQRYVTICDITPWSSESWRVLIIVISHLWLGL
jgi:hypothetical protein